MKSFKLIFNTIAQESLSPAVPTKDGGGKHDGGHDGGSASGNLTWGCYPHANTCTPACPGMAQRWWMFMVDENGCAGDGFIEVPLDFSGTGGFEMHWSIGQLSETEGDWTHEPGDFEPMSGVVNVTPGNDNLIRIDIRDNFGGPPCDWQTGANCPENNVEWGILILDLEYLPAGVTWSPQNIASQGSSNWNKLSMLVENVDPHTGPTIDLATYCEQNPQAPGCE